MNLKSIWLVASIALIAVAPKTMCAEDSPSLEAAISSRFKELADARRLDLSTKGNDISDLVSEFVKPGMLLTQASKILSESGLTLSTPKALPVSNSADEKVEYCMRGGKDIHQWRYGISEVGVTVCASGTPKENAIVDRVEAKITTTFL